VIVGRPVPEARPPSAFTGRRWPLIIVGGGPAAGRQLAGTRLPRADCLLVADSFGGWMDNLGPSRLQSYGEELLLGRRDGSEDEAGGRAALGPPPASLRDRLGPVDLQPTGEQYSHYVADVLTAAGGPVLRAEALDVRPDSGGLAVLVRAVPGDGATGPVTALRAHAVVLATGTTPRRPPAPWRAAGAVTFDVAYREMHAGATGRYAGRSVLVVGAGNSAMQTAALVGRVASDTVVLANRYHGLYPQETDDRFAWRSLSQLTCEMITKSRERCRRELGVVPCVRHLVYDDLRLADAGRVVFRYRAAANGNVLGRASLPPRCGHARGHRVGPESGGHWLEERDLAQTAVIWATGVEPRYPAGPGLAALPRDEDGYLRLERGCRTDTPGLFVTGACAGSRAVNEMFTAELDHPPPRPAVTRPAAPPTGTRPRRSTPNGPGKPPGRTGSAESRTRVPRVER